MELNETGVVNSGYKETDSNEGLNNSHETKPVDESRVVVYMKNPDNNVPDNNVAINGDVPARVDDGIRYDKKTGDIILRKKQIGAGANAWVKVISTGQEKIADLYYQQKTLFWQLVGVCALLGYMVYFGFAMHHGRLEDEGGIRLLVCTCIGVLFLVLHLTHQIYQPLQKNIYRFLNDSNYDRARRVIRWIMYISSLIATVTVIVVVIAIDHTENLLSLAGLTAFILISFVTSYSPSMVDWHPVYWGFTIQFYFAALILKTRWGYEAFNWLGNRITEFLAYSDAGAKFVFGDFAPINRVDGESFAIIGAYEIHFFAFKLMPVVTFFSTVISILYYIGVMPVVVRVIGRFLSFCLGTTPAESLNAAGNIFVAMTESPLMIKPFIGKMTSSELHAVMTGGFATIAGSVLGAYIGFGVPADHLLSASVMSAPAALAISKLTYPEIEEPIVKSDDYEKMEKSPEKNAIEAACNGANISAKIIAAVIVTVIAFLSLLSFINATLVWLGDRVGVEGFTFEFICSYLLYPVALFMGTELHDCRRVAELVGIKVFTNEFIAYRSLADLIDNRKLLEAHRANVSNSWAWHGDDIILTGSTNATLKRGVLSLRSEVISTYALCGFSNFGSMGILLGSLTALAPHRKPTMSKLVLRAMIMGNIACFFTACIAGLFYEEFD